MHALLAAHPASMLSRIGGTALVELDRANPHRPTRVFAKLEGQNASGSVKDRLALYLVADALEREVVGPDTTLVEASSGNTGISLAMICARLGLKLLVLIPDNVSAERHKLLRHYGAKVVLTPGVKGTSGAIEQARDLGSKPGYVWLAQHYNPVNSFAHYETTGLEIAQQLRALGLKRLDAFVASSGTTGTLMGISARLKEEFPGVKTIAVWPQDRIMGIRRPEGPDRPGIFDPDLIDDVIEVSSKNAARVCAEIARADGLPAGPSGGAAMFGALEVAARLPSGPESAVVALLPDWAERYLSTEP